MFIEKFGGFSDFMGYVGKLKRIDRTGWVIRGVKDPESVADHSFRTAIMALVLSDNAGVDRNRTVSLALVHELAESIVGDLTPSDGISKDEKHRLESDAFRQVCGGIESGHELIGMFEEYETNKTPEAQFVHRLDKLEMMIQAHEYGVEQPNVNLLAFWDGISGYDFGNLQEVFDNLKQAHFNKES